ncbi:methyltransferase family protein [Kribbella sp. VKM Ac-2568]|nr:methyltransferase family protein [Kribbella sp. VKM Ac-2568]
MSLATHARNGVNRALRPLGVQVTHGRSTDPAIQPFLSARRTIAGANRAGLPLGEYIDRFSAEPGSTGVAVEAMLRLCDFGDHVSRICEIGPGSGRYAEPVIAALRPDAYEIYETAPDWIRYLQSLPNLVTRPADGHTLAATGSETVDLVHSHKLFTYVPFVTTVGYLEEMARVVRPGGIVAFDIVTEDCMDEQATRTWVSESAAIYMVTPRAWTIDLLAERGLTLLGQHFEPLSGGRTELLVFRKQPSS